MSAVSRDHSVSRSCDDGCDSVTPEAEQRFLEWLKDNGARFPSLEWPSSATVGGVRGAVATRDIASDEPMMWIPVSLMVTPPLCKASTALSDVYAQHRRMFDHDDDLTLSLYLMHEKLRGTESFWQPFLEILPRPGGLVEWSEAELLELQDDDLVAATQRREKDMLNLYQRLVGCLDEENFQKVEYTYSLFRWAYMSVQARAFGRRLPWTALVPFADCLNHSNVQTKYDFDVDGNGVFRLFPSGTNRYREGCEAFNSYGRRTNQFLLQEYGFALRNNEWDYVVVELGLGRLDLLREVKERILKRNRFASSRSFRLHRRAPNLPMLAYCRLLHLNEDEIAVIETSQLRWQHPLSVRNEIAALEYVIIALRAALSKLETTVAEDEALLNDQAKPRLQMAVRFRLSKKRVILWHVAYAEAFLASLRFMCPDSSPNSFSRDLFKQYLAMLSALPEKCSEREDSKVNVETSSGLDERSEA